MTLTPRQADVLRVVRTLSTTSHGPPSCQAIGDRLGITRQAAKKHLDELERLGLVRDEPVLVRSGRWQVVG